MSWKDQWRSWRNARPERHFSFMALVGLTALGLVAFPGQDLPILFLADTGWIGLTLVVCATGTAMAMTGASRRAVQTGRPFSLDRLVAPTIIGGVLALAAVTGYKAIGGVGWPDWWQLLLGPLFVALAGVIGMGAGRATVGWRRLAGLSTAVLAVAIGRGGAGAFAVLDGALMPTYQRADQLCEVRAGIQYCANPGYEPLIDDWQQVVDAVLSGVPSDVAAEAELVSQNFEGPEPEESIATPLGGWGRGNGLAVAQVVLGLDVANWTTGVVGVSPEAVEAQTPPDCTIDEQARAIVAMWLAGRVSPEARDLVANLDPFADSITGTSYAEAHHGGQVAGRYASQLFSRSDDEVGDLIRANWDVLTDPATTYSDAELILRLGPVDLSAEQRIERGETREEREPCS